MSDRKKQEEEQALQQWNLELPRILHQRINSEQQVDKKQTADRLRLRIMRKLKRKRDFVICQLFLDAL
jgi:hypothetical protein